jgi:replicative DNA helicase
VIPLLEAEKSCMGCVLLRGSAFEQADLPAEAFSHPGLRGLWRAAFGLRSEGKPVDIVTLAPETAAAVLISECLASVPTAENVEFYAGIVREAYTVRKVRETLAELQHLDLTGDELLATAYRRLGELRLTSKAQAVSIGQATQAAYTKLKYAVERGQTLGIPTGVRDFDDKLGGLRPGVVTVVAGRPSMGKSSLVRSLFDGANEKGAGVHMFSCEDDREMYALRALSDHSRVNLEHIVKAQLTEGEIGEIDYAAGRLFQRDRWLVDDMTGLSSGDVALRVRREKEANGTRVVGVDYVQLMREADVRRDNRKANVEIALEGLLDLARRERMAVVVVSQLSRECERRDDKRPMLSDLRETGELEQCADIVLACYRDEYYDPETTDKGIGEMLVLKNKHGRTGKIRFRWDGPTATFRPLAHFAEAS